eukprot:505-Heterococcus_DN1.PRE.1
MSVLTELRKLNVACLHTKQLNNNDTCVTCDLVAVLLSQQRCSVCIAKDDSLVQTAASGMSAIVYAASSVTNCLH